jgi:sarcosine oxidase
VVVIGAGVMGSATARSLGARGVDVVLFEQFALGHSRGSSHGPVRIYRLSYPHPDYVRLSRRALPLWRELEEAAGERLLVTTGGLDCGPGAEECAASLAECGEEYEWLTPAECEERFPAIALDESSGRVLFQPDAGVTLADRTVAAQVRLAREAGVEVRPEVSVRSLQDDGDGVRVAAGDGELQARTAVVTAGSWAGEVLGRVRPGPSLRSILQTVSYFGLTDGKLEPTLPTWIEWGGAPEQLAFYALPPVGEAPGLKAGEHVGGVPVDPRDGPFAPDPEHERSLGELIRRRFPQHDPVPVRSESCLYTMTPDEDFIVDRVGNVVIGAGFSGHGFKFAPLVGEILADLAMGLVPDVPLRRFAVARSGLDPP